MKLRSEQSVDKKRVLAKAVLNVAEKLDLKQAQLAAVLGMPGTAISQLRKDPELDPESKQGERAILLIRIYRSLYALMGGDVEWMRHFMILPNRVTGGIPVKQIESIAGLVTVERFVDAMRGH